MSKSIDAIFKAIADPTRREIFHVLVLASAALPLTSISEKFDISRQGVTKHIKLLEHAGLVEIKKKGREQLCYANPLPLSQVTDWVAYYNNFWDNKLNALEDFLDNKSS
ncbi:MAG: helix-turn-helix domain-containing protein [Flavobacteriales bacterium]|nr:helix-turn-helix domain-containing protein [Flavobacteriales bacterium]